MSPGSNAQATFPAANPCPPFRLPTNSNTSITNTTTTTIPPNTPSPLQTPPLLSSSPPAPPSVHPHTAHTLRVTCHTNPTFGYRPHTVLGSRDTGQQSHVIHLPVLPPVRRGACSSMSRSIWGGAGGHKSRRIWNRGEGEHFMQNQGRNNRWKMRGWVGGGKGARTCCALRGGEEASCRDWD
jgi:hypothetical protein